MLQATLERLREEGRSEGAAQAKSELARRMLERGVTIEQVIEITELPEEQVRAIAAEIGR
ncbi:MAG: flagellar assembly protein H, partial [Spirochaetota bacterium]